MKKNPIAVVISDIHFNRHTLPLASAALESAINKASELGVPLVIAGDLHDEKDIIRGKVANALISLLKLATTEVYVLVGNHDLLNEKDKEHGLNYLSPYAKIIHYPDSYLLKGTQVYFIPYQSNSDDLKAILHTPPKDSILIMHQGFLGAYMGDYIQDKSSISTDLVKDFKVISGHYHKHQTIGSVTYIGSPYTITFGEANDEGKGFLILNSDGSFEREILNLRKHVILNWEVVYDPTSETTGFIKDKDQTSVSVGDLIWLKIKGPQSILKKINKKHLGQNLFGHSNFKLDLIPNDSSVLPDEKVKDKKDIDILVDLIDSLGDTEDQKSYLKELAYEIINS